MDQFIIDTHAFLWYANGDSRLSKKALGYMESSLEKWLSSASVWEMAIKQSLGKLYFKKPFSNLINEQIELNQYHILTITNEHLFHLVDLEFHHRDPFDRLIIAQSIINGFPILSADKQFDKYDIQRIW